MGIDEWRRLGVLMLLRNGKLTFAKAAAMSKLSLWEFADLVKRHNVGWAGFTPGEIEKEVREAAIARSEFSIRS